MLALLSAPDYRSFLACYYREQKRRDKRFSYAKWANAAGFKSRAFLRDVIQGRKRLSSSSVFKVRDSLKINEEMKLIFVYLVSETESDVPLSKSERSRLEKRVNKVVGKSLDQSIEDSISVDDEIFGNFDWPAVYAALGPASEGSNVKQIVSRTGLPRARVDMALEALVEKRLCRQVDGRFYAVTNDAILDRLKDRKYFKLFYLHRLSQLSSEASKRFSNRSDLFLALNYSIDSRKKRQFREELEQLLMAYSDDCESADGDEVITLVCGMF